MERLENIGMVEITRVDPPAEQKQYMTRIEPNLEKMKMADEQQQPKSGIIAVTECLEALSEIGNAVKDVFSDGKVNLADLGVIPAVTAASWKLIQNVPAASKEIKDLDREEIKELGVKIIESVFRVA